MTARDLRDKYGGDLRQALNRAIRTECAGGDVALNRLAEWADICEEKGWIRIGNREADHVTAYRHLLEVVDAMEDYIRQAYGMPPRGERGDLNSE